MRRIYALLYGITLISTFGVAKTGKVDAKYEASKKSGSIHKNTKRSSSKLITHKIQSGDTLYAIALKHHTTVAKVRLVNSLEKGEKLKIGGSLKIPGETYTLDSTSRNITVTSAKKEMKKKVEVKKIALSEKAASIKPSVKKQKHSEAEKEKNETFSHTVKKGDSLYAIAKSNHISVETLKKANKIESAKNLKLGQVLTIPGISQTSSTKIKIAKIDAKVGKATTSKKSSLQKLKIAKIDTKTNTITTTSKKSSPRKLVLESEPEENSFFSFLSSGTSGSKATLKLKAAKKQLGKRYVWGAEGPFNFDCSGFTSYVCKKNGVCVPRTSIDQSKVGKRVSRSELKPGDLIFFDTSRSHRGYVNHVGIYMGNGKFIHASSAKKKVVIGSLEDSFYKSRFKWGTRVKG